MVVDRAEVDNKSEVILGKKVICFSSGFGFAGKKAWTHVLDVDIKVLRDAQDLLLCEFVADLLMELF